MRFFQPYNYFLSSFLRCLHLYLILAYPLKLQTTPLKLQTYRLELQTTPFSPFMCIFQTLTYKDKLTNYAVVKGDPYA